MFLFKGVGTSNHFNLISSGIVFEASKLSFGTDLYKIGSITGLTKGQFVDDCATVRTNKLEERGLGVDVTLHKQIKIRNIPSEMPFAELGDSGAPVFAIDNEETYSIGVFEGEMNHYFFASPIEDAIKIISKSLSYHKAQERQSENVMDFERYGTAGIIQVPFTLSGDPVNSRNGPEMQTPNIEANIIHHAEHTFSTVKEELTAIKVYVQQSNEKILERLDNIDRNVNSKFEALTNLLQNRTDNR